MKIVVTCNNGDKLTIDDKSVDFRVFSNHDDGRFTIHRLGTIMCLYETAAILARETTGTEGLSRRALSSERVYVIDVDTPEQGLEAMELVAKTIHSYVIKYGGGLKEIK